MVMLNKDQKKAVELTGSNILVFASAGGGKTTVLVQRLMKRIIEDKISIDEIVAMTFTKAASENMKNRLSKALNNRIKEEVDPSTIAYLNSQMALLSNAKISTIDSFCLDIVKEYYYLVNIKKEACDNMMDESIKEIIINKLIDEIIYDYLKKDTNDFIKNTEVLASGPLFSFDYLKDIIKKIFDKSLNQLEPLLWLDNLKINHDIKSFEELDDKIKTIYLNEITNYLNIIIANYEKLLTNDDLKDNNAFNTKLAEIKSIKYEGDYRYFINQITNTIKTFKANNKDEEYTKYRNIIIDAATDLASLLMSESTIVKSENIARPINNLLIDLTKELYMRFKNYKIDKGFLDFSDCANYAYQILTLNNYEIANKFKYKYKEIMIDEFQDTNDIQFAITSLIANNDLFLVGDIKQSIYRFRGAKPGIMESLKQQNDFIQIHIKNNYRSNKNIVDFNNTLFNTSMNINGPSFNEYDAQIADLPTQSKNNVIVEFDNYVNKENDDDFARTKLIAYRILKLHREENLPFKDMVILVKSHSAKTEIKKVFDDYNIPYFISDQKGYFNSYTLEVFLSYLKLLFDYNDKVSLYSVLSSKLYNYSDDELVKFNLNPSLLLKEKFYSDFQTLKEYANQNDLLGLYTYFLNINSFYLKYLNTQERANLDLLIKNYEDKYKVYTVSSLIDYILETINHQKEHPETVSEDADVVKVMTIHHSKGLEFDTVFVYSNSENRNKDKSDAIIIDDEIGLGFNVSFFKYKDKVSTIRKKVIDIHNNIESINEDLRVLYVALTRAKRRLFFVDKSEQKTYDIDKSLTLARKGYSSYIYNIMKDSTLMSYNEYAVIPTEKPLNKINNEIKDIKLYTNKNEVINTITPSSLKNSSIKLNLDGTSGSDYGTKLHKAIEDLDLNNLSEELIKKYDETINPKTILNLFNNPIYKDALNGEYYKEYPFYFKDNNTIINGIIDFIAFKDNEIILIDYKTDHLETDIDFIKLYQDQLSTYKKVLSNTFNKTVKSYIYSFYLNKMIEL